MPLSQFPFSQLLRNLRANAATTTQHLPQVKCPNPPARRHNSGSSNTSTANRQARMIPRSHTAKPTLQQQPETQPQPQQQQQPQPINDISSLNLLGNIPPPATAVDECHDDGFLLDNRLRISHGSGALLVGGEAFAWRPWEISAGLVNERGQFEVDALAWGLLSIVWPRPGEFVFPYDMSIY